jgi:hypothetical protein
MDYRGNHDLLQLHKTAFLRSQKCPVDVVFKSYNWMKEQCFLLNKIYFLV